MTTFKGKDDVLTLLVHLGYMTGMKIEKDDEGEKVNVCKAIQGIEERGRAAGIAVGRYEGIQIGAELE